MRDGKGGLYEGGVRVCAFATWDGHIPAGTRIQEPLHIVDWYPTLLKLAGASLQQKLPIDGQDAWPTIAQGKASPHQEILLNTAPNSGALRVGDWKLKLSKIGTTGETVELFNLRDDLSVRNNLAASHPGKVKELRARYERWARQAAPPKALTQSKTRNRARNRR